MVPWSTRGERCPPRTTRDRGAAGSYILAPQLPSRGRHHHPRDGATKSRLRGCSLNADPGAHGTPGGAQARRSILQCALQGAHAIRADDSRAGRLLRDHAVQSKQRLDRGLAGYLSNRARSRRTARKDDRIQPRDVMGPPDVSGLYPIILASCSATSSSIREVTGEASIETLFGLYSMVAK